LVDWLGELLYLHEVDHLLFREFSIETVGEQGLKAVVRGEPFQEGIHSIKTEIKAVTYHQIQIKEREGGWKAQVIFDL
jgi:SHS2 domain-containing protein